MKLGNTGMALAALAAGSLAMATPAQAHGDDAAVAIGAGVVGLAIGAAIASDHGDRDVYVRYNGAPRYYGGYYPAYPVYRAYPAYPAYRPYPGWQGYDPGYERWRARERYEAYRRWERHGGGGRGW